MLIPQYAVLKNILLQICKNRSADEIADKLYSRLVLLQACRMFFALYIGVNPSTSIAQRNKTSMWQSPLTIEEGKTIVRAIIPSVYGARLLPFMRLILKKLIQHHQSISMPVVGIRSTEMKLIRNS